MLTARSEVKDIAVQTSKLKGIMGANDIKQGDLVAEIGKCRSTISHVLAESVTVDDKWLEAVQRIIAKRAEALAG